MKNIKTIIAECHSKPRVVIPQRSHIDDIVSCNNPSEFCLDVTYRGDFKKPFPDRFVYNRIQKRYYHLIRDINNPQKIVKNRIKEDDFHLLFKFYLEGGHQ